MFAIAITLSLLVDFLFGIIRFMLGDIDGFGLLGIIIGSAIYNGVKIYGGTLLKGALIPFIGPFAWLVEIVADLAFDIIASILNIKEILKRLSEYIVRTFFETIMLVINALSSFVGGKV